MQNEFAFGDREPTKAGPPSLRYWIGVASRDHVKAGSEGGFCQLCHGKASAVKRLHPDDWIVYYSPKTSMLDGAPLQAFTAIGRIAEGKHYVFDMGNGFLPSRRDVSFLPATDAPIRPLIDRLSFIKDKTHWAYPFRFGILSIPRDDFALIANAMGVSI